MEVSHLVRSNVYRRWPTLVTGWSTVVELSKPSPAPPISVDQYWSTLINIDRSAINTDGNLHQRRKKCQLGVSKHCSLLYDIELLHTLRSLCTSFFLRYLISLMHMIWFRSAYVRSLVTPPFLRISNMWFWVNICTYGSTDDTPYTPPSCTIHTSYIQYIIHTIHHTYHIIQYNTVTVQQQCAACIHRHHRLFNLKI